MNEKLMLNPIGTLNSDENGFSIRLKAEYKDGLRGLSGFSHLSLIWWFSGCDNETDRASLTENAPYKNAPKTLGVFATRSPMRPNPIALSVAEITYIDSENGIIGLGYTDAADGSPLLDIKPYTPSVDRVAAPRVPDWCGNWPDCVEESGDFDWGSVFNF